MNGSKVMKRGSIVRQDRRGLTGSTLLAGILLAVSGLSVTAVHAQEAGGLYRDGVLVDSFFESSRSVDSQASPLPLSTEVKALSDPDTSTLPGTHFGPVGVSAETRDRNARFVTAGKPGVEIRDLLGRMQVEPGRDLARDRKHLQKLLQQLRSEEHRLRAAMAETRKKVRQLGLDSSILNRHKQTMQAFEAGRKEFYGAIEAVVSGKEGAMEQALEVVDRFKFQEDPPLLHGNQPLQRHVQKAPIQTREQADALITPFAGADAMLVVTAAAAPAPEDLVETPDIKFTPGIIAKAAELNNSPQAIFDFVSDNVSFQPYLGSRKGAAVTLEQLRGNDTDQASLLIALLRSAGIPARYVRGTAEREPEAVMSWLGVDDAATAASILTTAGLDGVAIVSGPDVVAIRWTHVWVEAFVPYSNYRGVANEGTGSTWVAMDPGFKQSRLTPGENVLTPMGFNVDTFINTYISSLSIPDPLEQMELDIQAYLDANDPGKTVADIERKREIEPQLLGLLPGSPAFSVLSISSRFSELEASKRYKVRFHLYDGGTNFIDHTIDLPELAGKRLTIEYVGATTADQDTIDAFGGIYETPPNLINVKPVLELDGVAIATSSNAIGMGYSHSSDMEFIQPVGASNVQPLVQNEIIAGNGQSIGFDTFLDVRDSFLGGSASFPTEDFLEGILHTTANGYLSRVDRGMEKAERLMRVVTTQDVSEAIVENAIAVSFSFGIPVTFEWTGLIVDADRRIIGTFDVDGDSAEDVPFMKLTGIHGSLMENRVFEEIFAQDAVSTTKILQLASDAGIGICTITTSVFGDCPGITQPVHIISALNSALAQGNEITIPEDPITVSQWSGTGYIDMDPATGAGGYIISGGISGSVQTISGGATVDSWPVSLPCEATSVTGNVLIPPADSPDSSAVFCADNSSLSFKVEFTSTCEDDSTKTHQQTFTTSKTKEQIGGGNYTLELSAFGSSTIIRAITIVEVVSTTKKHAADGATPDTRTTVGVAERVTISTNPSISTTWSVSGGGAVSPNSGPSTLFTAGDITSTSNISATVAAGTACMLDLTVIPPNGITYAKISNQNIYPVGDAGAGMLLSLRLTPLTVSFGEIDIKEIGRDPINVTGYFVGRAGFHNTNPDFVAVGDDNFVQAQDDASSGVGARPKPWSDGSYTWPIPNHYNRRGAAGDGHLFVDTAQTFTITSDGTCGVTKGAASTSRHPVTGYAP